MDIIINKFKNLNTNDKNMLDDLFDEIDKMNCYDPDIECKKLIDNYYKLCTLKWLVLDSNILMAPFIKFMEKIDSINQYYLSHINLDPEYYDSDSVIDLKISEYSDKNIKVSIYDINSLKNSVIIIKSSLEDSLNCNDPIEKMEHVLTSYSTMITMVQIINNETYDEGISEDFTREFKKRKF